MADFGNVDMLAEAREAQWSALTFLGEDAIKLVAPAKVNLFLGVGARRADGYHDVETVMHALALHDVVYMLCEDGSGPGEPAGPGGCLSVSIDMTDKTGAGDIAVDVRDNLVFKAIDALAHEIGHSRDQKFSVRIEKHIPAQAGLGGGSADAAAALVGAAHFWGVSESGETLRKVAASLGADVAFFLEGGCGFFAGAGERFERHIDPTKMPLVLVKPDEGVSTAEAYAAFDRDPVAVPAEIHALVENASEAVNVPLYNNLEPAAEEILPQLAEIRLWLAGQNGVIQQDCEGDDAPAVLMSGSGSAIFAVCDTYADALRIAAAAGAKGWWSRATTFSSLRAAKV